MSPSGSFFFHAPSNACLIVVIHRSCLIDGLLSSSTSLPPFQELEQILRSSLVASMGSYDLQISVLVKGSRGSGKRTVVRSVAAASGLGVMEVSHTKQKLSSSRDADRFVLSTPVSCTQVNCFDIIGDTDLKTEGVLRARFERASGCSPCVLLLRNVEALARKGQVLETGKGESSPISSFLYFSLF